MAALNNFSDTPEDVSDELYNFLAALYDDGEVAAGSLEEILMKIGKIIDRNPKALEFEPCVLHSIFFFANLPPFEIIELLVRRGPEALRKGEENFETIPLHSACSRSDIVDTAIIELLISSYPESILITDNSGMTSFMSACRNGAPLNVVRFLYEKCPGNIDKTGDHGSTPFMWACQNGASLDVIRFLYGHCPGTFDKMDDIGNTALHYACFSRRKYIDMFQFLLSIHPNAVKIQNIYGFTPLHILCRHIAPLEYVRLVFKAYPHAALVNTRKKQTSLNCAIKYKYKEREINRLELYSKMRKNQTAIIQFLLEQMPILCVFESQGTEDSQTQGFLQKAAVALVGNLVHAHHLLPSQMQGRIAERLADIMGATPHITMADLSSARVDCRKKIPTGAGAAVSLTEDQIYLNVQLFLHNCKFQRLVQAICNLNLAGRKEFARQGRPENVETLIKICTQMSFDDKDSMDVDDDDNDDIHLDCIYLLLHDNPHVVFE